MEIIAITVSIISFLVILGLASYYSYKVRKIEKELAHGLNALTDTQIRVLIKKKNLSEDDIK